LPDDEKAMFRQMGVFLAPASVEDIAAITQVENPRVVLDTLVRRSLVRMREGNYALLPIVRDYAEGKLAEAGQNPQELHKRAVNYYGQKGTIESALVASEHLFELAARFQSLQAAEEFVKYVYRFYQDLVTRGYWSEARRKTEQLIVVARALGDKTTEARSLGELENMFMRVGEYERVAALHQQAQKR